VRRIPHRIGIGVREIIGIGVSARPAPRSVWRGRHRDASPVGPFGTPARCGGAARGRPRFLSRWGSACGTNGELSLVPSASGRRIDSRSRRTGPGVTRRRGLVCRCCRDSEGFVLFESTGAASVDDRRMCGRLRTSSALGLVHGTAAGPVAVWSGGRSFASSTRPSPAMPRGILAAPLAIGGS
jgi:hypothetical protein